MYASITCFCKQHPHATKISQGQRGQRVIYRPHRNNKQLAPTPSKSNRTECVRTDERTVKAKKKKKSYSYNAIKKQKVFTRLFIYFYTMCALTKNMPRKQGMFTNTRHITFFFVILCLNACRSHVQSFLSF